MPTEVLDRKITVFLSQRARAVIGFRQTHNDTTGIQTHCRSVHNALR